MNKEKFTIPIPDEHIIQSQIEQVISSSINQNITFPAYLQAMVRQVGIKHLFVDRWALGFILFTVITLLGSFLSMQVPVPTENLYAFIFIMSPLLFLLFSFYTYVNKVQKATYEVEMTCKYNVYQVIAFRMLVFSIISIIINTFTIAWMSLIYADMQFIRALMISITALFIFSVLFLYVLMKKRSTVIAIMTICGWTLGNLFLRAADRNLYGDILLQIPLYVYAIVLLGCLYMYMSYMKKLIDFKQSEGV